MNEVLDFWFKTLSPKDWWTKSDELDLQIKEKFLATHTSAIKGELGPWRETPDGRLAEVIVLDQFSRNIYRDDPRSFAYDGMALILAQEAIRVGDDLKLDLSRRSFIYMPHMHSESLLIHNDAVELFSASNLKDNLNFELAHKEIIEKFGRYPHRNNILGRASSTHEIEFLKGPNSSF